MSGFKTRLEEEKGSLEDKLTKLNGFLSSGKVKEVDDVQQALLHVQASAMTTYLKCLEERIKRLDTDTL